MSNSSFSHIFLGEVLHVCPGFEGGEGGEKGCTAGFQDHIRNVCNVQVKNVWFGANLLSPKSRLEGRRRWLSMSTSTSWSSSTSRTILQWLTSINHWTILSMFVPYSIIVMTKRWNNLSAIRRYFTCFASEEYWPHWYKFVWLAVTYEGVSVDTLVFRHICPYILELTYP